MEEDSVQSNEGEGGEDDHEEEDVAEETGSFFSILIES